MVNNDDGMFIDRMLMIIVPALTTRMKMIINDVDIDDGVD
jgi:hypothetical protein